MANTSNPVRISLKTDQALKLLMQVRPTADMPRPSTQRMTAKPKRKRESNTK